MKALDTIDAVFKENRLGMGLSHMRLPIDNVMVTGASKRGWTTWTLASVDKRYFYTNNRNFIVLIYFKSKSSCSYGPGLFEYGGNFP